MDSNCQICQASTSKYACPRCNLSYCSVICYQSEAHIECSEKFYEKCVKEELKNQGVAPDETKKMYDILIRNQQQTDPEKSLDSDDSESEPDLAVRVADINLEDGDAIWEKLNSKEKKEFKKLVSDGDILKMVPVLQPWWLTLECMPNIRLSFEEDKFKWENKCPPITKEIPDLSSLTKKPPSPFVKHMLLNILGAYVITVRWFKTCYLDMCVEAVTTCLNLSDTLSENEVYDHPVKAFKSLADNYFNHPYLLSMRFNCNQTLRDLKCLATGKFNGDGSYGIKCALSDLERMVSKALLVLPVRLMSSSYPTCYKIRYSGAELNLNQLKRVKKKITYFLSWTLEYGHLLEDCVDLCLDFYDYKT